MVEIIGAIAALLAGLAAAVATIVSSMKKVEEGNYATLRKRVAAVEGTQRKQNIVIAFLTDWQLVARQYMRLQRIQAEQNGLEPTPEMHRLQDRLDRELNVADLLDSDKPESPVADEPDDDGIGDQHWWNGRHAR